MLFRRDIEPQCSYCRFGVKLGSGAVGCTKHGVISEYSSCRKFTYDPYSRVPELPWRIPDASLLTRELTLKGFDPDSDDMLL